MKFLADSDPDFMLLRPELRDLIRESEKQSRAVIKAWFGLLPQELTAGMSEATFEAIPSGFLRGQLPVYRILDALWPLAEKAQREKWIRNSTVM